MGSLKRETESLLTAALINATWTYYVKIKIGNAQYFSGWMLCRDRDEDINHMITECKRIIGLCTTG